jgi:hypothetical protein
MTIYFIAFIITAMTVGIGLATMNERAREVARMADAVAEAVTAIQAGDDARLTRARVALDNLVAPRGPYRQIDERRVSVAPIVRQQWLRYRHALENISSIEEGSAASKIARKALER